MTATTLDNRQSCRQTRDQSRHQSRHRLAATVAAVAVPLVCLSTHAQASTDDTAPTAVATGNTDTATTGDGPPLDRDGRTSDLNVALSPYIWLSGVTGTVGKQGLTTDISSTFIDILSDSDRLFGLMGALDVEYRRFVFQFNGTWTHVELSDQRGRARDGFVDTTSTTQLDLELDTVWLELFGGYRFVDTILTGGHSEERSDPPKSNIRLTLDGFVGGRVTWMRQEASVVSDLTVTLPSGQVLEGGMRRSVAEETSWIEPFVGARATFGFGDHWELALRGDVGGFSVDNSKFSWQASALLGYRWHHQGWSIALFGGYRALSQDYSSGDFVWDATAHGPLLGASFQFTF